NVSVIFWISSTFCSSVATTSLMNLMLMIGISLAFCSDVARARGGRGAVVGLRNSGSGEAFGKRLECVGLPEEVCDAVLVGRVHLDVGDLAVPDRVDAARRKQVVQPLDGAVAAVRLDDPVVADRPERDVVDVDPDLHQRAEEREHLVGSVLDAREGVV